MKPRTNIVVAFALAGLFTLFNVGLPIILFVCPMMNGAGVCDCSNNETGGLVISYPSGECCNHAVVAERNTIPFLNSSKYQAPSSEVVLVLSCATPASIEGGLTAQIDNSFNTGPPPGAAPIYLLTSTLLI